MARINEIDISSSRSRSNTKDIPEEERRSVKAKNKKKISHAKQRLKKTTKDAEERRASKQDKADKADGVKNRKSKREKEEDSNVVKKLKNKKSDLPMTASEKLERKKKRLAAKRNKKTVGELIDDGKVKKAKKRLAALGSKALVNADKAGIDSKDLELLEGMLITVPGSMTSEAQFLEEYEHIYSTLKRINRKFEEKMLDPEGKGPGSRDVYALSTLYSQLRETMADMRSIKDLNEQAEELAIEVFDPVAKSAAESLIALYYKLTTLVRQEVKDPAVVESLVEKIKLAAAEEGNKLQVDFTDSRNRIVDVMNGTK